MWPSEAPGTKSQHPRLVCTSLRSGTCTPGVQRLKACGRWALSPFPCVLRTVWGVHGSRPQLVSGLQGIWIHGAVWLPLLLPRSGGPHFLGAPLCRPCSERIFGLSGWRPSKLLGSPRLRGSPALGGRFQATGVQPHPVLGYRASALMTLWCSTVNNRHRPPTSTILPNCPGTCGSGNRAVNPKDCSRLPNRDKKKPHRSRGAGGQPDRPQKRSQTHL